MVDSVWANIHTYTLCCTLLNMQKQGCSAQLRGACLNFRYITCLGLELQAAYVVTLTPISNSYDRTLRK